MKDLYRFTHILVNCGNHEKHLTRLDKNSIERELSNATYLQDSTFTVNGIVIFGAPWVHKRGMFYRANAFAENPGVNMERHWRSIPDNCDILMTHIPPCGVMDEKLSGHEGCPFLLERVLEVKPSVHVFGHVHEGHNVVQTPETLFINTATTVTAFDFLID